METVKKENKISVIIPVYEEGDINGFLSLILNADSPVPLEVIVVDGSPDGTTVNRLIDNRVIRVLSSISRSGQMNRGAEIAAGSVLLFLHADTFLPKDAFQQIYQALCTGPYSAGAFRLGINSRKFRYRLTEGAAALRNFITSVPFGDQAIFIRRELFDSVGRYGDFPLMEDIDLMQKVKRTGSRIVILKSGVLTSPRRWEQRGFVVTTLENWYIQLKYLSGADPEDLYRRYYRSRP